MLRIITLNLNGIRSAASKGLLEWLAAQKADVVCLQEVKASCELARDARPPSLFGHSVAPKRLQRQPVLPQAAGQDHNWLRFQEFDAEVIKR